MLRSAIAALVCGFSVSAMAQMSPVGLWQTIDDKDGTPKSEIRIVESAGVVSGKIEKILDTKAKPGEKCVECTDERKDQVILKVARSCRCAATLVSFTVPKSGPA